MADTNIAEIISLAKGTLDAIADRYREGESPSDKEWTRLVLTKIGELGQEKYCVYAGVRSGGIPIFDGGGYLFDLCWLKYDQECLLERAVLVLESEWQGHDSIDEDFEKLLLARADLRVMVFGGRSKDEVCTVFERLGTSIERFSQTDIADHYLLCGYSSEDRKFHHKEVTGTPVVHK